MNALLTIVAVASILVAGCAQQEESLEQRLFEGFIEEVWRQGGFVNECMGSRYDPAVPLLVYDKPAYSLAKYDVIELQNDEKAALLQEPKKTPSQMLLELDLSRYPGAQLIGNVRFPSPGEAYLVRFSDRFHEGADTFVQLWIKGARSSSGARMTLRSGPQGDELTFWDSTCDDDG